MTARSARGIRALVDANLLVSVLLSPNPARSAAAAVLAEARAGSFSLIVPVEALEETVRVVGSKPWLAARVAPDEVQAFLDDIAEVAEITERLERLPPPISRDRGDDYLIGHALTAAIDVLVTRDRDLLVLEAVAGIPIMDPVAFLAFLRRPGEPGQ